MKPFAPKPAPRSLIIVANPDAQLSVAEEGIISHNNLFDLAPLVKFIAAEKLKLRPLFDTSEKLLNWKNSILKALKEMVFGKPIGLSLYYKVVAADEILESLAARFREDPAILAAYVKPGAEPPLFDSSIAVSGGIDPGSPTTDLTKFQRYLKSASQGGVDADFAWTQEGGRGKDVRIIDIEASWNFSHEDLKENQGGVIGGVAIEDQDWRNHGTAVAGVIGGDRNGIGVTGICPDADMSAISIFGNTAGTPINDWGVAKAIRRAADMLDPGGIILIELHYPGPSAQFKQGDEQLGYIPAEWWPCNLAAIKYAVGRGIIVVEAGGNGGQNLDDDIYNQNPSAPNGPFPPDWSNPFNRELNDSGAIIVGAGDPPIVAHHTNLEPDSPRSVSSNFGRAIDVQGWGDQVATCGYGGLSPNDTNENHWYTSRFNGTSSAAAMIAGVLGSLQGIVKAQGGLLTPEKARKLLRNDGLRNELLAKHPGSDAKNIGVRPDLSALINSL